MRTGTPRTIQQAVANRSGIHVFELRWGAGRKFKAPERAMVNTDLFITKGLWTAYAAVLFKGNPRFGEKEPAIAVQYKFSPRLSYVERRYLPALITTNLTAETSEFTDKMYRTIIKDAGLENTPNDRAGLVRLLDEFLGEVYTFNTGWHKGVKENVHQDRELTITHGDDEHIVRETNM